MSRLTCRRWYTRLCVNWLWANKKRRILLFGHLSTRVDPCQPSTERIRRVSDVWNFKPPLGPGQGFYDKTDKTEEKTEDVICKQFSVNIFEEKSGISELTPHQRRHKIIPAHFVACLFNKQQGGERWMLCSGYFGSSLLSWRFLIVWKIKKRQNWKLSGYWLFFLSLMSEQFCILFWEKRSNRFDGFCGKKGGQRLPKKVLSLFKYPFSQLVFSFYSR